MNRPTVVRWHFSNSDSFLLDNLAYTHDFNLSLGRSCFWQAVDALLLTRVLPICDVARGKRSLDTGLLEL